MSTEVSGVTDFGVLTKATEWLVQHVAKDRVATAVVAETDMIDVSSGLGAHRSQIPGQTTWYVEYREVNRIGGPLRRGSGRVEVHGDLVGQWIAELRPAPPETFTCMWCGQEFQAEDERDQHEEGCG